MKMYKDKYLSILFSEDPSTLTLRNGRENVKS